MSIHERYTCADLVVVIDFLFRKLFYNFPTTTKNKNKKF